MFTVMWQTARGGLRKTREKYTARKGDSKQPESVRQRQQRRILPYAVPVAAATWLVLAWKIPALNRAARAMEEAPKPAVVEPAAKGDRS
jgi:hypothetical protein